MYTNDNPHILGCSMLTKLIAAVLLAATLSVGAPARASVALGGELTLSGIDCYAGLTRLTFTLNAEPPASFYGLMGFQVTGEPEGRYATWTSHTPTGVAYQAFLPGGAGYAIQAATAMVDQRPVSLANPGAFADVVCTPGTTLYFPFVAH